ncbi:uncharacterized protein K441DRAFT_562887, partial [Cenococcum geophilum 1.58]|uniref:uncharacterized protein n=1 Tax=Cenococcum geophilum 1.58 TaxID=794803 RepID=UPI00358FBF1D
WLYYERDLNVTYPIIYYVLKKEGWLRKVIRCIAELYRNDIRRFPVDIMVFLNKAIFNKKTSWRTRGRALVGKKACY